MGGSEAPESAAPHVPHPNPPPQAGEGENSAPDNPRTHMTHLANQVVWITGASSGIGEALATLAAQRGAKLVLSSRRETELERVRQSCPRPDDVAVLPIDLSDFGDADALAARAASFFGPIDVLVN